MKTPIYELICDNITDGVLRVDFSLPDESPDGSAVKWAPGAMDGVTMYHMGRSPLDDTQRTKMEKAVRTAAAGNDTEAEALFFEWTLQNRAIRVIDELQKYVMDHSAELEAGKVYGTALSMMRGSSHIECVKIGLSLMELLNVRDEKVKEIIRTLGLYDEFTVFSVWNMHTWENGNDEIFALAGKVHGWGRIHAVECLQPETEEIRHWLLTEGAVNDVMSAYSALTCWLKSGAEEILYGRPTPEEYKGIVTLIEGLLDEGPVTGISELENAPEILLRFLELAPEYDLSVRDYDVILSVCQRAEDENSPIPQVSDAGRAILHSPACLQTVREAVKEGEGFLLAEELGIPLPQESQEGS